jgi:soluble lytic murein transglycosylase-like protein
MILPLALLALLFYNQNKSAIISGLRRIEMNRTALAVIPGFLIGSLMTVAFARSVLLPSSLPQTQQQAPAPVQCSLNSSLPTKILRWCSLIEQYSAQNGLEPGLVAAVMLQESGGNPDAISSSGAVGLLQVMPRDGRAAAFMCPNGPCFSNRPSTEELLDPNTNLAYGTRMLAGLIGRYGDEREALLAYGPVNNGYSYADKVLAIKHRFE